MARRGRLTPGPAADPDPTEPDSPRPYRGDHGKPDSPRPYRGERHGGHYSDSPRPYGHGKHKKSFLGDLFG